MAKGAKRRTDPLLADALAGASAAYLPQIQALLAQRHDRASQYTSERRGNAATEDVIRQSVDEAVPDVKNAFADALATVHAQQQAVQGMGGSVEGAQVPAFERRTNETLGNALLELAQQKQGATSQKLYANETARSGYLADQDRITGSLSDVLAQQSGAAVASYGKAKEAQRGRTVTRKGQDIASGDRAADRASRERIAAANRDAKDAAKNKTLPGGIKPLSAEGQNKAQDSIQAAQTIIEQQVQHGMTAAEAMELAATGRPGQTVQGVNVPGIPKQPRVFARAGYELATFGRLSDGTVARLHKRGVKVPGAWRPKAGPKLTAQQQKAVTGAVQSVGLG